MILLPTINSGEKSPSPDITFLTHSCRAGGPWLLVSFSPQPSSFLLLPFLPASTLSSTGRQGRLYNPRQKFALQHQTHFSPTFTSDLHCYPVTIYLLPGLLSSLRTEPVQSWLFYNQHCSLSLWQTYDLPPESVKHFHVYTVGASKLELFWNCRIVSKLW